MAEEEHSPIDVYRPPVTVTNSEVTFHQGSAPHYVVSLPKLLVLFFCSFGLYQIVWFVKHWFRYRNKIDHEIRPVLRGIFAIFFAHRLFAYIKQQGENDIRVREWDGAKTASIYVVLVVLSNVVSRFSKREAEFSTLDAISLMLFFACVFPLYVAQNAANVASGDPEGQSNNTYSAGNIVLVVLGLLFWVSFLLGTLSPLME